MRIELICGEKKHCWLCRDVSNRGKSFRDGLMRVCSDFKKKADGSFDCPQGVTMAHVSKKNEYTELLEKIEALPEDRERFLLLKTFAAQLKMEFQKRLAGFSCSGRAAFRKRVIEKTKYYWQTLGPESEIKEGTQ